MPEEKEFKGLEPHPTWEIIDSSKLQTFMECPRLYFYKYILGWTSDAPRHDLIFGEAFHAGLETLYTHGFGKDSLELAKLTMEDLYSESFGEEAADIYYPKSIGNAKEALELYVRTYSDEFRRYEVIQLPDGSPFVEVAGYVPIGDGLRLHFRIDTGLRDLSTGLCFPLEHKTASRGGAMWLDQWPLSMQVGTYTHAFYCLFPPEEVYGARVNGIIFLKRGTEFMRCPCSKTPTQMEVWRSTANITAAEIVENTSILQANVEYLSALAVLPVFPLRPVSCTRWGTCAFHDYCMSWANPLTRCEEPPMGFHQEFWNPAARRHTKEIDLTKKD
jgi:hypothetical protein